MDLDSLFQRAFDGFGGDPEAPGFPGVPGSNQVTGNGQAIVDNRISRCSRFSRSGKEVLSLDQNLNPKNANDFSGEDRAREFPSKSPGNTGTPGNEEKTLAESTSLQFPVKDRQPGTPGTESGFCGPAFSSETHPAPPPGDPLPISADAVRAGVARELRALAEVGREGPGALRDAVEITRAKIRNSEAVAPEQWNGSLCHVCDGSLNDGGIAIAVLTGKPGRVIHLHAGCHDEHGRRITALVDRIMAAAGYSTEEMKLCA